MAFLIAKNHNRLIYPARVRNQNLIIQKHEKTKAIILIFCIKP